MNHEDFSQQSERQSGFSRGSFSAGPWAPRRAPPLLGAAAKLVADEPAAEKAEEIGGAETQDQARTGRLRRAGKLDRQALPEARRV